MSTWRKEPRYPVQMASKVRPCCFQWSAMGSISSVRSRKVKPLNWVWVDSTAVGTTAHSMPMAERMGRATVREHLPTADRS